MGTDSSSPAVHLHDSFNSIRLGPDIYRQFPYIKMNKAILLLACLLSAQAEGDWHIYKEVMSRSMAEAAIEAAVNKSQDLKVAMNIAVVDLGANLVSFTRMDSAWLGSVDISIKKAKTSAMFNMTTGAIGKLSQPGGPLYNIEHSNNGLITFPGGVPVRNCGHQLMGAVGVSGSTVENDHTVAMAAVQAINCTLHH